MFLRDAEIVREISPATRRRRDCWGLLIAEMLSEEWRVGREEDRGQLSTRRSYCPPGRERTGQRGGGRHAASEN